MASSCRAAVTPATEHLGGYQDTLVFAAVGEAFQPALHWTSMLRKEGEANFRMERPQKAERHPRLQPCRYEYYQCTTTTTVIKVTSVIKVIMVTSVNSVIRIIRVSMVIRMIMVRTILRCGATSYEGERVNVNPHFRHWVGVKVWLEFTAGRKRTCLKTTMQKITFQIVSFSFRKLHNSAKNTLF
jgi:hypothetical protein